MRPARGEEALRREIGVVVAALLVVNGTIGTGIFKMPAVSARLVGSMSGSLAVWVAGGVIALCGALTLGELAAAMPRSGGLYEFVRRGWGPTPAFLYGWTRLVLLIPAAAGGFARLSAESLAALCGWSEDPVRDGHVALAFLVPAAALNLAGVRTSTTLQAIVTATKYGGVLALAAMGLSVAMPHAVPAPAEIPAYATAPTIAGVFAALVSVMWAYDGWADLSEIAGEVRNPGRTLPRALIAGSLAIIVVYLLANLGYARALGLDGLRMSTTGSNMAAANTAGAAAGVAGRTFLSVLILVSCAGCAMSSLLTGPRVLVPMAADGVFLPWFGAVTARTGVPSRAIVTGTLLAVVYVEWRSFEQLSSAFVTGVFPFYLLAVAGVYVLRAREPDLVRPYRVPGYPVTPAIFIAGAIALLSGALLDVDTTALFAFGIVALGIPVRLFTAGSSARSRR